MLTSSNILLTSDEKYAYIAFTYDCIPMKYIIVKLNLEEKGRFEHIWSFEGSNKKIGGIFSLQFHEDETNLAFILYNKTLATSYTL